MNIWNEHGAFDLNYTSPSLQQQVWEGGGYWNLDVCLSVCKPNVFQALMC